MKEGEPAAALVNIEFKTEKSTLFIRIKNP
jgi:hypothetical protein